MRTMRLFVWEFLVGNSWIGGIGHDEQSALASARAINKLLHPADCDQACGEVSKVIPGPEVSSEYYAFLESRAA